MNRISSASFSLLVIRRCNALNQNGTCFVIEWAFLFSIRLRIPRFAKEIEWASLWYIPIDNNYLQIVFVFKICNSTWSGQLMVTSGPKGIDTDTGFRLSNVILWIKVDLYLYCRKKYLKKWKIIMRNDIKKICDFIVPFWN